MPLIPDIVQARGIVWSRDKDIKNDAKKRLCKPEQAAAAPLQFLRLFPLSLLLLERALSAMKFRT